MPDIWSLAGTKNLGDSTPTPGNAYMWLYDYKANVAVGTELVGNVNVNDAVYCVAYSNDRLNWTVFGYEEKLFQTVH